MALLIEPVGLDPSGTHGQCTEIRLAGGSVYLRSLAPQQMDAWKLSAYGWAHERHITSQNELEKVVADIQAASVSRGESLVILYGQEHPTRYVIPPGGVPIFRIR